MRGKWGAIGDLQKNFCEAIILVPTALQKKRGRAKRAYENAIRDFIPFTGIARPDEFRTVTRAHVVAWRDDIERREIGPSAKKRTP
jgi:hypothetical protein